MLKAIQDLKHFPNKRFQGGNIFENVLERINKIMIIAHMSFG
jgi:hypothetical protein